MELLKIYRLSSTYRVRPSELLNLGYNSWLAYQFDAACLFVGTRVENAIEEERSPLPGGKKRQKKPLSYIIAKALNLPIDDPAKVGYVSPERMMGEALPRIVLPPGETPLDDLLGLALKKEGLKQ